MLGCKRNEEMADGAAGQQQLWTGPVEQLGVVWGVPGG